MQETKLIQYIGNKDVKTDTVTNTRPAPSWRKGETLKIPVAQANILLKYPDVWREVLEVDGMLLQQVESENNGADLQREVSETEIQAMDEEALREVVRSFSLPIRFQASDDLDKMRQRVIKALEQAA